MVEGMGLSSMESKSPSMSSSPHKFHPNPPIGSKVAPPQKFKRPPFWND
jgi:hypothetical protein